MNPNPQKENQIGVYNPLSEDFSVTYDISGRGEPVLFTVHAGEIEFFEPVVARHVKKHLVDKIYNLRGKKFNSELDKKEISKEVSVEI